MSRRITIGIAEDHDFVRKGFVALLKDQDQLKVVFDVRDGQELLLRLKNNRPDIILLDIEMPVMNGMQALDKLKKLYPEVKIIVISAFYEPSIITEAFKKGAKAFLPKNCKVKEVLDTIFAVSQNKTSLNADVLNHIAGELMHPGKKQAVFNTRKNELTERDIRIIKYICNNKTSREIADLMALSEKTIEAERSKIFRKTKVTSALELIKFAVKNQIVRI